MVLSQVTGNRKMYPLSLKQTYLAVTMIPWEMFKQLVWDVAVADALAPSHLDQGSLCNPGTTANEAEMRKIEKYRELIDKMAMEVQGSLGESSDTFITRLCKMLSFARRTTSW